MNIIDTGLLPIWSVASTTTESFIPMTGALNTAMLDSVRASFYFESDSSNISVRWAYNLSDDGVTWDSTATEVGTSTTTSGWTYDESSSPTALSNDKLFMRFGLACKNGTGTKIEQALGRLRLEVTPANGNTVVAGPSKVWSDGSANYIFHPLTSPMPIESVTMIRGSVEMEADSGSSTIIPAYQVSNDGLTWYDGGASSSAGTFTTFGTALTGDGKSYGTTLDTIAPVESKQWIRFGVGCKGGSVAEACLATLRVDRRG